MSARDSIAEAKPQRSLYEGDQKAYRKDYKAWNERERRRKQRLVKHAAPVGPSTVDLDDVENAAQGIRKATEGAARLKKRRERRVAKPARIKELEEENRAWLAEALALAEREGRDLPAMLLNPGWARERAAAQEYNEVRVARLEREKRERADEAERVARERADEVEREARERAAAEHASAEAACVELHKIVEEEAPKVRAPAAPPRAPRARSPPRARRSRR